MAKKKRNISVLRQRGVEHEGSRVKMKQTRLRPFRVLTCCYRLFRFHCHHPSASPSLCVRPHQILLLIASWPWKNGEGETHAHWFPTFLSTPFSPSRISQASRRHRSRNNLLKPQSRIDAPRFAASSSREFSRGLINGGESGGVSMLWR